RRCIMEAMTRGCLLVGLCLFCALSPASADESPAEDETLTKARAYYDEAQTEYAIGRFAHAIELYKQAYALTQRPSMLFNIAQAYRLANDPTQAKFFYESYLRRVPDAPNRPEIEQRIDEMEQAIAKMRTAEQHPVAQRGVELRPVHNQTFRVAGI